jgi:twitching motility two-component system response regulator PilH
MKKILAVDDSTVDLQHLERLLVDAGAVVITASTGEQALQKARSELPQLILLDVNMPGLDGFSTARKLAADPSTKSIPVVFVTAKDQKADRAFAQMLGAKGFITKPCSAADLAAYL